MYIYFAEFFHLIIFLHLKISLLKILFVVKFEFEVICKKKKGKMSSNKISKFSSYLYIASLFLSYIITEKPLKKY